MEKREYDQVEIEGSGVRGSEVEVEGEVEVRRCPGVEKRAGDSGPERAWVRSNLGSWLSLGLLRVLRTEYGVLSQ